MAVGMSLSSFVFILLDITFIYAQNNLNPFLDGVWRQQGWGQQQPFGRQGNAWGQNFRQPNAWGQNFGQQTPWRQTFGQPNSFGGQQSNWFQQQPNRGGGGGGPGQNFGLPATNNAWDPRMLRFPNQQFPVFQRNPNAMTLPSTGNLPPGGSQPGVNPVTIPNQPGQMQRVLPANLATNIQNRARQFTNGFQQTPSPWTGGGGGGTPAPGQAVFTGNALDLSNMPNFANRFGLPSGNELVRQMTPLTDSESTSFGNNNNVQGPGRSQGQNQGPGQNVPGFVGSQGNPLPQFGGNNNNAFPSFNNAQLPGGFGQQQPNVFGNQLPGPAGPGNMFQPAATSPGSMFGGQQPVGAGPGNMFGGQQAVGAGPGNMFGGQQPGGPGPGTMFGNLPGQPGMPSPNSLFGQPQFGQFGNPGTNQVFPATNPPGMFPGMPQFPGSINQQGGSQFPGAGNPFTGNNFGGMPSFPGGLSPNGSGAQLPPNILSNFGNNIPGFPGFPSGPNMPNVPTGNNVLQFPGPGGTGMPSFPGGTGMPSFPEGTGMQSFPGGTGMPSFPGGTGMPSFPGGTGMPSFPGGSGMPSFPQGMNMPGMFPGMPNPQTGNGQSTQLGSQNNNFQMPWDQQLPNAGGVQTGASSNPNNPGDMGMTSQGTNPFGLSQTPGSIGGIPTGPPTSSNSFTGGSTSTTGQFTGDGGNTPPATVTGDPSVPGNTNNNQEPDMITTITDAEGRVLWQRDQPVTRNEIMHAIRRLAENSNTLSAPSSTPGAGTQSNSANVGSQQPGSGSSSNSNHAGANQNGISFGTIGSGQQSSNTLPSPNFAFQSPIPQNTPDPMSTTVLNFMDGQRPRSGTQGGAFQQFLSGAGPQPSFGQQNSFGGQQQSSGTRGFGQ